MGAIEDAIKEIIRECDEAKAGYEADRSDMVAFGQLLAYAEALSILKDYAIGERELEKLLDFDIDERYLITAPNT